MRDLIQRAAQARHVLRDKDCALAESPKTGLVKRPAVVHDLGSIAQHEKVEGLAPTAKWYVSLPELLLSQPGIPRGDHSLLKGGECLGARRIPRGPVLS